MEQCETGLVEANESLPPPPCFVVNITKVLLIILFAELLALTPPFYTITVSQFAGGTFCSALQPC
jgi:hypothetical protein